MYQNLTKAKPLLYHCEQALRSCRPSTSPVVASLVLAKIKHRGLSGKKQDEKAVFEEIGISSYDVTGSARNIDLSKSDSTAKSVRRTFYLTIAVLQGSRAVQTTSSAQAGHRYRSISTFYMPSRISVVQGSAHVL
jgi:hypothetical protein